jgi:hypothetical protein
MTDTLKATPRPWAVMRADYIVPFVDRNKPLNWSKQLGYATPLCETHGPNNLANAALIVTAVNAYDAMREALEAVAANSILDEATRAMVTSALAAAEGKVQ